MLGMIPLDLHNTMLLHFSPVYASSMSYVASICFRPFLVLCRCCAYKHRQAEDA